MDDLVRWLRAQFDEDAEAAQRAFSGQSDPENGWGAYRPEGQRHTTITPHVGIIHEAVQADHIVTWNPARVLLEIEAKRRQLTAAVETRAWAIGESGAAAGPAVRIANTTLRLLALPYNARTGYRNEWRP